MLDSQLLPFDINSLDEPMASMTQPICSLFSGLSRIALLVGVFLFSAALAAPSSMAQDEPVPVITEDEVDGTLETGDTFTKEIKVQNLDQADDINAVDLTLDFGDAPVDVSSVNVGEGTLLDDFLTDTGTTGTQVSISGASQDALGGGANSGVLAEVVFEVTDGSADGTVTFPDVRFNDVNAPDADLSQADFDVITSDTFVRIENAVVRTTSTDPTVEVSASDLSSLGITNFDIEIEVGDPGQDLVALDGDNPVDFLSADLANEPGVDANYDASNNVLSISGITQDGLAGGEPLFNLNVDETTLDDGETVALSFLGGTEFRDDSGDPVDSDPGVDLALSNGQLQVLANGAPSASADSDETTEDEVIEVTDPANGVLANDTDPEGDSLTASLVSDVSQGNLSLNGDGTFSYDPNDQFEDLDPGQSATETFTYEASDGFGGTDQATVTITIRGVEDETITAISDTTINEDTSTDPIEFAVDDGDPNTDPSDLSVDGQSNDQGLVPDDSIEFSGSGADRTVTVTPSADSFGTATITVTATDPEGSQVSEDFVLTVESVNDAPVAVDDSYPNDDVEEVLEDDTLEVEASNGLLANDRHPDGENFTVSEALVSTPDDGSVDVSANGSFEYIPNADFAGTDQFVYQVSDGDSTDTATVTIDVEQINDQPTITELPDRTIKEDSSAGPIDFTIGDVETAPENLSLAKQSSNTDLVPTDSIELSGSGAGRAVTVTPTADSFGTAVISLTVTDQEVDGKAAKDSTQSFELTVESVNDPAVVEANEGLTLEEGGTETIPTDSLSASDVEDGAADLTFDVTDGPSNGTLLVGGSEASSFTQADLEAGAVSYSHDGSETTSDSFTFDLSDTAGEGPEGQTFAIDVQPVNEAPAVATNEGLTVEEAGSATITADSLSASDPDDGAEALTFEVTSGPENGALTVEGDTLSAGGEASSFTQADLEAGSVSYGHDDSETTSDSFTFDLSDAAGEGPEGQTFDITVQPVDDEPVISGLAEADTTIDEDTSTGPIGFTIGDDETAPEDLAVEKSSSNPGLVPNDSIEIGGEGANRTVTVTPTADSNGTADITVTVVNGNEQSASQTFTLTVEPVNDPPVISGLPEADTIDEDASTGPIEFAVSDPDNDPLQLTAESGNTDLVPDDSIELGFSPDGRALVATPSADSNGTADITVTVEDDNGATDSRTLTLEVTPVNDAPVAVDDQYSTDQGETLRVSAPEGVLENDRHPDGEPFTASEALVSTPGDGSVNLSADGSFEYTPETGFAGTDQFVYEVSDGDSTDTATVTIDVQAVEAVISGTVSYPEEGENELTGGRPLSGVPVEISAPSGDVAARDTTGNDGTFSTTVQAGEYTVEALFGERDVPGVINATDANRTIGAFLGDSPFVSDFQREVADVNDSGSANATDALKMALFFIDRDGTTFEAGDWATTARTVDVSDGTGTDVSVLAAAYGDANLSGGEQSGADAVAATASTAAGSSAGSQARTNDDRELRGVGMEETFEVPVRLNGGEATVGSYSLQVDFPAEKVSFEGVAGTERDVMSAAEGGTVRLSWFDQSGDEPVKLGSGAELVTLRFRAAKSAEKGMAFAPEVTVGELAGPDAEPLTSARLSVEGVEIGSTLPEEFALEGNYPNPTSGQATIEMNLPSRTDVTVEVYNALGQRVQVIEQSMAAGTGQTVRVDGSRLASGQYFYRVKADLEDSTVRKTGRITVVR